MIAVCVLGPVSLRRDGQAVVVPGGKTAELLVRLALDAGTVVRTDRLIEDLWDDQAVTTARNTLQSKVSRLRRAFGDPSIVSGDATGYTLAVGALAVDALHVLHLVGEAAGLQRSGDHAGLLQTCEDALALFAGDVLPGAGDGAWARPHRARLTEAREALLDLRAAARVELGALGDAIGELEALVEQHPLRESLWATLIVALYRDGRQADALGAYNRARHHLAEELGLTPGPALQALERQVLLQDPRLDAAKPTSTNGPSPARSNLPALTSPLLGRDADCAALVARVDQHRLVTITGPAGVGKTRTAIEVSRLLGRDRTVVLARLDAARDAASLHHAVGEALGLLRTTEADIVHHLGDTELVLTLDNCEHLLEAVVELATRLVDAAPNLRLLCTSQRPLGLDGEVVYRLDPLGMDAAVELFRSRADTRRRVPLATNSDSAAVIEAVCRSLDGLPLAIELAAARAATLPLAEIARRLDDRFSFLTDPTSSRPPRQRTLGAAIGWSYDLLFPDDQRGLWALACFTDGAPLSAIEAVLLALEVPSPAVLDVIDRLVDRSLVVVDQSDETARFRLLGSISVFASARLADAGLTDVARGAHAQYFGDAAQDAADGIRGPDQAAQLALVRRERANIDAALAWSRVHDPALALRIASGYAWASFVAGDAALGAQRLHGSLHASMSAHGRAVALQQLAWLDAANDIVAARRHAETALSLAADAGDERLVVLSKVALAFVALQQARPQEVLIVLEGCTAVLDGFGERWHTRSALSLIGHAALAVGDLALAQQACAAAAARAGELDDDWVSGHVENLLGLLAQAQGRFTDAAGHLERAVEASRALGLEGARALQLANLGRARQQAGDLHGAADALESALDTARTIRDFRLLALARLRLGLVRRAQGDTEAASAAVRAAHYWYSEHGGDGADLATCVVAALDADGAHGRGSGRADAVARLEAVRRDAQGRGDLHVEILALDALARSHASNNRRRIARELLDTADRCALSAGHHLSETDRVDAVHARRALAGPAKQDVPPPV